MSDEQINHPVHYGGDTPYEAIKVIEAWELDFPLGNAVKYIARAGKKKKEKEIEDLEKAIWYIQRKVMLLKAIQEKSQITDGNTNRRSPSLA